MKTLWTIIAVLALANVLAIAGVLGWLHTSGRLNKDRVEAVRKIFTTTVEQDQRQVATAAEQAKQAEAQATADARAAIPPRTAAEQVAELQLADELRAQVVRRQQQDLESLRATLLAKLADLEQREQRLVADRKAFADERKKIAETDGAAQFKVALATIEQQKPKDAKAVLKAILDAGNTDQVVAYLAKMDDGKRSKIVAEFVRDDAAVAADLLERLRTRGVELPQQSARAGQPGTSPDEAIAPSSAAPDRRPAPAPGANGPAGAR